MIDTRLVLLFLLVPSLICFITLDPANKHANHTISSLPPRKLVPTQVSDSYPAQPTPFSHCRSHFTRASSINSEVFSPTSDFSPKVVDQ